MEPRTPNPPTSEASNQRGLALADRGWLEEALREFDRAIELDGSASVPRINRASVYMELERWVEALADLLAAVELAPEDPEAHFHLGLFLTRHGAALGQRELEQSLEHDPEHLDALLQLGASQAEQGRWSEAERTLDAALDIDPADPLARRERGLLALDVGQVHEAIEHLKLAQQADPDDVELAVDLALAHVQAGFLECGADMLSAALERQPDQLHALYNLAAVRAERGDADAALELLDRALALDRQLVLDWLSQDPMFDALRADGRLRQRLDPEPAAD